MKVLVTGHLGYIGVEMVSLLRASGHEVAGLDTGLFNECDFVSPPDAVETLDVDLRDVTPDHLRGFDAVAHLGALSNDPLGDLDSQLTFDINLHAHRWAARHLLPGWLARGEGYFCSTASAAGLLAQIGSAPYSLTKHAAVAFAEWMSITYGDQGIRVSCLCPQGVNTAMLNGTDAGAGGLGGDVGGNVVRLAGVVLEPDDVAVVVEDAIRDERFLILPHPEVAEYMRRKAADPDRWLAGMRKLQRRVLAD